VTAALVAAVVVFALLSLPPARLALDTSWSDGSVPGIFHIHTNRSDGRSTPEEVAAAASKAGLKFIVLTDHGDATRKPDPPTYRSGVLCLDAVEISTANGHYIAFDMGPAPYPLGGEGRDVIEDVRRLGGFGIAAHPDSPKPDLSWSEWTVPVDGLELVNPDTAWRVHMFGSGWAGRWQVLRALLTYPVRPSETIGALLTESPALRTRWTELGGVRRLVGIAGVDAHARLELRAGDHGANAYALPIPGYESTFRTLSVHVVPTEPLTGDAAVDAHRIASGIRQGQVYTAVDAWASPPHLDFTAANGKGSARAGGELQAGGPLTLRVRSNAPRAFRTSIHWNEERLVADSPEREISVAADGQPGRYRVEIRSPAHPTGPPWLVSNPIYVRAVPGPHPPPSAPRPVERRPLFDGRSEAGWTTERDATSLALIEAVQMIAGIELRLRFGLSGGAVAGQYAGAAVETAKGVAPYDRATVAIRAERPMRVSVQMRAEFEHAPPERWQRSIYVDTTSREQTVFFDDMRPVGPARTQRPPLANVRALMFIIDTINTKPGTSGRIWMKDVRLEK